MSEDSNNSAGFTEQLVRDNIGWMLALAERMLQDREMAQDVVQEAFIDALRGLENFKGESSIKTWLHRITVNASITRLRKLKRLAEHSIDQYLPEFDRYDCRIEAPWPYLKPVSEVLENDDLRARVSENIAALPEPYRVILQLRDIEGYSTGETASLLDISDANVKVRLHRARSALKKMLEPILRGEIQT